MVRGSSPFSAATPIPAEPEPSKTPSGLVLLAVKPALLVVKLVWVLVAPPAASGLFVAALADSDSSEDEDAPPGGPKAGSGLPCSRRAGPACTAAEITGISLAAKVPRKV